jgi:hypothetical protein
MEFLEAGSVGLVGKRLHDRNLASTTLEEIKEYRSQEF